MTSTTTTATATATLPRRREGVPIIPDINLVPPSPSETEHNYVVVEEPNIIPITMPKSESKPIEIVDVADDEEEDVSLLYATPKSRNVGTNPNTAISVEQYSDDRDLQLAIMASFFLPQTTTPNRNNNKRRREVIDLSLFPDDDDDVQVLFRKPFSGPSISEMGQSSNSKPTFVCEICTEPKPFTDSFAIMGCTHSYCSDCMVKYIASKLQENIPQIRCPVSNCTGLLEPEHCRPILPPEVFDRWGSTLCEAVILASEKFYCPYRDCSALLINDGADGEAAITQSECPNCRRLFCAQCKVAWHSGIECAEFQKLNEDERGREDLMLMKLAKEKQWIRCPKCKFYVEKSYGCLYMRCRCGHAFCYSCGAPLKDHHYCNKCNRTYL